MDPEFREAVNSLQSKFKVLIGTAPNKPISQLPKMGVYLFCENDKPIYVGRSNNIRQRFRSHWSSDTNKAALARLIVCETLGIKRDYGKGREKYKKHPGFRGALESARKRIRAMDFRAVEEVDQMRQALLEVYCAIAAKTKYNSFENH